MVSSGMLEASPVTLENEWIVATVDPRDGGVLTSVVWKPVDWEWVSAEIGEAAVLAGWGRLTTASGGFPGPMRALAKIEVSPVKDRVTAVSTVVEEGRSWEITKTFFLPPGAAIIDLTVSVKNTGEAGQTIAPRWHSLLRGDPEGGLVLLASTKDGVHRSLDNEVPFIEGFDGRWMAAVQPGQRIGLVLFPGDHEVKKAFFWHMNAPTVEWILSEVVMQPGEVWSDRIRMGMFSGLASVDAAWESGVIDLGFNRHSLRWEATGFCTASEEVRLKMVGGANLGRWEGILQPGSVVAGSVDWKSPGEHAQVQAGGRTFFSNVIPDPVKAPLPFPEDFQTFVVGQIEAAEKTCVVPAERPAWEIHQQRIRQALEWGMGDGLPRVWGPLRARTEGSIPGNGFLVEHITAEFWPGHRTSVHAFVPEGEGPFPSVVVICTSEIGGRHSAYQKILVGLARRGILGVGVASLGKGTRSTANDAYGMNSAALLAGTSIRQEQENGIRRVVDWLVERPDVDTRRIGITGDSNAAGSSLFSAAMDTRIEATALVCLNWTFRKWLLPHMWKLDRGAETAIPGLLAAGGNIPTVAATLAPRPLRFISAEGERNLASEIPLINREAERAFAFAGAAENFSHVVVPGDHGYGPAMVDDAVAWFAAHWGRTASDGRDTLLDESALSLVPIPEDPGGRLFEAIIRDRIREAAHHRRSHPLDREQLLRSLGLAELPHPTPPFPSGKGTAIESEPGWTTRYGLTHQQVAAARVVRVVTGIPEWTSTVSSNDPAEIVVAVPLRAPLAFSGALSALVLLNRPPLGMAVRDAQALVRWLREAGPSARIELVGAGEEGGCVALLTAALEDLPVTLAGPQWPSLEKRILENLRRPEPLWAFRLLWVTDLPELRKLAGLKDPENSGGSH